MGDVAEANPEAPRLYKEETQLPLGAGTMFFSPQIKAWSPGLARARRLTRILLRWQPLCPLRTLCLPSSPEGL